MINRLIGWFRASDPAPAVPEWARAGNERNTPGRICARLLELQHADDAERPRAEAALRREIDSVPPGQWPAVDAALRGWRYLDAFSAGHASEVKLAVHPLPGSAAVEALASHGSGYVRAPMVRMLAEQRDGREVRPLLLRAKDWVSPVREPARAALRARVMTGYEEHWAHNLALVLWAAEGERADPALAEDVIALLTASERGEMLLSSRRHAPEASVRHAVFGALTAPDQPRRRLHLEDALRVDDVAIRLRAARVIATLPDEDARGMHAYLRLDPSPVIRAEGVALAVRVATDPEWMLREALLDRSSLVRHRARFHLKTVAPLDVAAFYRDRVTANHPQLALAVAGLGETGRAADAEIIIPYLHHPATSVRRAAVRALARLAGGGMVEPFVTALADVSGSVSRQAAEALRTRVSLVPAGRLAVLAEADAPHIRRNALWLLMTGPAWSAIGWILRGCADGDPRVAMAAQGHLRRWRLRLNRTAAQPTEAQKLAAREAMTRAGDRIPPSMKDWLHFVLR